MTPAIDIRGLTFRYPGAREPVFRDLSLSIPPATRCLLLGANGVGKSTRLKLRRRTQANLGQLRNRHARAM
jgi:ABC-type bacteriocin/lantibiotic exporter with double-glycine peptidase domain